MKRLVPLLPLVVFELVLCAAMLRSLIEANSNVVAAVLFLLMASGILTIAISVKVSLSKSISSGLVAFMIAKMAAGALAVPAMGIKGLETVPFIIVGWAMLAAISGYGLIGIQWLGKRVRA